MILANTLAGSLVQVIVASVVATAVVSSAFATALFGMIKASESRRQDEPARASAYAILAIAGLACSLAAVAFGLVLLTQKS